MRIDPWPLMQAFAKAGATLALPVAFDRDYAIVVPRLYADGDPLGLPDAFNIRAPDEPPPPCVQPDIW